MRVNARGQVTIPREIRRRLGLLSGTEVAIDVVGHLVRIRKVGGRGREIVERLTGRATMRLTTDQILALTRE